MCRDKSAQIDLAALFDAHLSAFTSTTTPLHQISVRTQRSEGKFYHHRSYLNKSFKISNKMKSLVIIVLILQLILPLASSANLPSLWRFPTNRNFTDRECMMCKFSVGLVSYSLRTQRGADQVYRITNSFCALAHVESPLVCSNISKLFNQEIVKVLSNALVTPDQVCGYLSNNTCGRFHDPWADWEVNLNISASLDQAAIAKMRAIEQARREPQKPFRVIQISDTHVDLKYQDGSEANCEEPLCCRSSSSVNKTHSVPAGYWGAYNHCDVPLRTLESALKALNATMSANGDIEYIIWTGDIQPHDVWDQNKKSAIATYDSVFAKIFEYLPNARIFPTLGNHEMVPVDSFSPSNLLSVAREDSPEWLYKKMDSFWSRWLPSDTVTTITKDGFYAVSVKPGLKVISMNTNFCHDKNFWLYINSTDPGNQLQWLVHELQLSELEHEQVHIIGHIPPGTNDCLKVWSKNFNKILRRFSKTIGGQFYGHTHNSEFEIFYDRDGSERAKSGSRSSPKVKENRSNSFTPVSVGFIGPSITTFIDVNPSFRIYTVDPNQGYMPTDFETHYMNLTEANLKGDSVEPKWTFAGRFAQQFNIKDTTPTSLHDLVVDLVDEVRAWESEAFPEADYSDPIQPVNSDATAHTDSPAENRLYKLYQLFHSYSDTFTRAEFDKLTGDKKRLFLCQFLTGQSHNQFACEKFIHDSVIFNPSNDD